MNLHTFKLLTLQAFILFLAIVGGHSTVPASAGNAATPKDPVTENGTTISERQNGMHQTYLPLLHVFKPFDPSLHDVVGLYQLQGGTTTGTTLYTIRLNGTPPQVIFAGENPNHSITNIRWSPDGQRIFFLTDEDSPNIPYLVNIDGTELTQIPLPGSTYILGAWWSPDNNRIMVVYAETNADYKFAVIDTQTMVFHPIPGAEGSPDHPLHDIAWSPDGTKIAYAKDTNPDWSNTLIHTFMTDADGSELRQVTGGSHSVKFEAWVDNGSAFIARVGDFESNHLLLYGSDGTLLRPLVSTNGASVFAVAPNQHQFIYGVEGYLYLQNIFEGSGVRVSNRLCWGHQNCHISGPAWSPSGESITFGNLIIGQQGQPGEDSAWVVPLTPTPQVPDTPFIEDAYILKWLTDRYLASGTTLIERESGLRRELFPYLPGIWTNLDWRELPSE